MTIAARVESYLHEQGVSYELVPHRASGSTHESAVAAHVRDDHVAKAVIVRDARGDAMAVIPGDTWLQLDALNRETGRDFQLDEESDLGRLFPDCVEGAVPPLGPAYGVETFLDEGLATLANVYFEAGDHRHLVHVKGEDFLKLLPGVRHGLFGRTD
jgi:Ala-tRNA(Pro) deacylase